MLGAWAKITASCKKMDPNPSLLKPCSWITLSFFPLKIIFPLIDDPKFNFQDFNYMQDSSNLSAGFQPTLINTGF